MATFLTISKHSTADCPIHNVKMRKLFADAGKKTEELYKKAGCKEIGSWADMPGHTIYVLVEAPSAEALQKTMMDPFMMEMLGHNETEIKMVMTTEESMKLLK
jgi:hypothetical protein